MIYQSSTHFFGRTLLDVSFSKPVSNHSLLKHPALFFLWHICLLITACLFPLGYKIYEIWILFVCSLLNIQYLEYHQLQSRNPTNIQWLNMQTATCKWRWLTYENFSYVNQIIIAEFKLTLKLINTHIF